MMDPEEIKQRVEKLAHEMVKLGKQEPIAVCYLASLIHLAAILESLPHQPEEEGFSFRALRILVAERIRHASQILEPEEQFPQYPLN